MEDFNIEKIETNVEALIKRLKIISPPVTVKIIADYFGVEIIAHSLGDSISGALITKDGKSVISYNPSQSIVRRRFTIAHEIGHHYYHKNDPSSIFIDELSMMFRQDNSSNNNIQEKEANAFAAALLMPRSIITKAYNKLKKNPSIKSNDQLVNELADRFEVSAVAMSYRLFNLGFSYSY